MIIAYGAPKNYDAQCPEHNHKYTAKIPGRRSQKTHSGSHFEHQVAVRVSQAMIIDELYHTINNITTEDEYEGDGNQDDTIIEQSTKNVSFATAIKTENDQYIIKWKKKENNDLQFPIDNFAEFLCVEYERNEVTFCTEYCRAGKIFRCHPDYGNKGAYYDWILVQFDDNKLYPCKMIACIPGSHNNFEGYNIIVQATYQYNGTKSVLFMDYLFSPDLMRIDAECIEGQCFVIKSNIENNLVSLALDRDK